MIVTHRGRAEKVYVDGERIKDYQIHDEAYEGRYRASPKKDKVTIDITGKHITITLDKTSAELLINCIDMAASEGMVYDAINRLRDCLEEMMK